VSKISFGNFRGGLVVDPQTINVTTEPRPKNYLNHLTLAENVIFRPNGKVATRCGFREKSKVPIEVSPSSLPFAKFPFAFPFNTDFFCLSTGTRFYLFNPVAGTWDDDPFNTDVDWLCGTSYQDKVYLGTASEQRELDPVTKANSTVTGAPPAKILIVHNDRLWAIDPAAPMTLQATAVAAPTDWTNGYSKTLDGEQCVVNGLGSLDGDLYIFTNLGVWIHSGYGESDFQTVKLSPMGGMPADRQNTIKAVSLGGRSALLFVDASGHVMAANRSGVREVCRPVGQMVQDTHYASAGYQDQGNLYILSDGYLNFLWAIHCDLPYKDSGGETSYPVSKFTSPSCMEDIPLVVEAKVKVGSTDESGGKSHVWIFTRKDMSVASRTFPVFSFCQVDRTDPIYDQFFKLDDYLAGSGYFQAQGKIRLVPFNAGTDDGKSWLGAKQVTTKPISTITQLSMVQYMDQTLTYPVTITETVAPGTGVQDFEIYFQLYGFTEWTQLETSLFGSSAAKSTPHDHYLELQHISLEYQ
jgi:hypothetical protein